MKKYTYNGETFSLEILEEGHIRVSRADVEAFVGVSANDEKGGGFAWSGYKDLLRERGRIQTNIAPISLNNAFDRACDSISRRERQQHNQDEHIREMMTFLENQSDDAYSPLDSLPELHLLHEEMRLLTAIISTTGGLDDVESFVLDPTDWEEFGALFYFVPSTRLGCQERREFIHDRLEILREGSSCTSGQN